MTKTTLPMPLRGALAVVATASLIAIPGASPAAADPGTVAAKANAQVGGACTTYYGCRYPSAWCADFARWVWGQSGAQTAGLSAAAYSFYSYGKQRGTLHSTPQVGDAVVYATSGNWSSAWASHVNLVVAVDGDSITTVGGNESGGVRKRTFNWRTNTNPTNSGPIRAFVGAVWNAPPADPDPVSLPAGTLVKAAGNPTVKVIISGAGIPITADDVTRDGYDLSDVVTVTSARFNALPGTPPDGTVVQDQSGSDPTVFVLSGGVALPLNGVEFSAAGYDQRALMGVPTSFLRAASGRGLPDRSLVKAPGNPTVKILTSGAGLPLAASDVQAMGLDLGRTLEVPPSYFDGLRGAPDNGTLIKQPGNPTVKVMVDGSGIPLTGADVTALGYDLSRTQSVPAAFFTGVSGQVPDKTLVKQPGHPTVKVMAGGAAADLSAADVTELGYDLGQVRTIAPSYFAALGSAPADGTLLRTASDPTVWIITNGKRHPLTAAEWNSGGYRDADVVRVPTAFITNIPSAG
ncbi:CHAP domain-containing protein [Streptomyces sp. NPDC051567]|uniref:CHAP domain-containing protein n=1 Tax=Streptomyces sp. NPDC051567 TaxID=3365660 RepID=UPI0037955962